MRKWTRRLALVAIGAVAASVGVGAAQAPAAVPGITPAEAAPFMGDWVVVSKGDYGESTFAVSVKNAADAVTLEISSDQMPMLVVSNLSRQEASLVASYEITYEGNQVPVVLTLTPSKEGVDAVFDYANGAYVAYGKGTKKAAGL